jgi:adenylosuccinate synthase
VEIEPVYKSFGGWQQDITAINSYKELPVKLKEYIDYLNNFLKVPVKYISNGPNREQIVTV